MASTIDSLEIQIQATATKANNALDNLITKLDRLDSSLSAINGSSLNNLANGVDRLTQSMSAFNASGVKTQDFTRLASNITRLGAVNTSQLTAVSNALNTLSSSFSNLSATATISNNVNDLITSISRLGYKSTERAVTLIPQLSVALRDMFTTLSQAPRVSQNVIEMTNSLANLASQGGKVGSAARTLNNGLNGIGRSSDKASKKVFSLASAFGRFYASYFLVIRSIKGMMSSITTSMNYVETFNYLSVTLDKMSQSVSDKMEDVGSDSADAYAEGFGDRIKKLTAKMTGYAVGETGQLTQTNMSNLGLDPNQLMNFQARIGAVATSVGLIGDQAEYAQQALSMLSADLSSLTNTDLETVMTNLSSGLIGQSRALYKYGIDITNASLQELAFSLNLEKSVSEMTQSEKMQLRILKILQDSTIAWGDQANTVNSVANQYRIFQQQVQNLARVLGNLFLPILQKALPVVNGLIISLQNLFTTLGFKIHGDNWLTDIMDGISGGASDIDGLDGVLDDTTDTIDNATESAKKFKQQLQGFDELNVITTKDDSTTSSLGQVIDLTEQIAQATSNYEKVWNEAFTNMENKAQSFANNITDKLQPVYSIMEKLFNGDFLGAGAETSNLAINILDFIIKAMDKVDWEKIGNKVGEFLSGIDWLKILDKVAEIVAKAFRAKIEIWLGMLEKNPLGTLTLTFASIAWQLKTGEMLSNLVFKRGIAKAIGGTLGLSGIELSIPLALTALIVWDYKSGNVEEKAKKIGLDRATSYTSSQINSVNSFDAWSYIFQKLGLTRFSTSGGGHRQSDSLIANIGGGGSRKDEPNQLGAYIGEGVLEGFKDSVDDEASKTTKSVTDMIFESLKISAGIHSPSTVMMPIGKYMALGVFQGLKDEMKSFNSVANTVCNSISSSLKSAFSKERWANIFSNVGSGLNLAISNAIKGYANGGFTSADVFFANENGIPELVGTVGGRTAVASGTEITGISDAVYSTGETQASLLNTAVNLLQVIASNGNGVSDEYIFNSFRRSATQYTNRTGSPAIPI